MVAARTALIVDFFLPAPNLTDYRETLSATRPVQALKRLLVRQLAGALRSTGWELNTWSP